MDYLDELKAKIRLLHGYDAMHAKTVPVREVSHGQVIWGRRG